jgi:hypothetical protein
LRELGLTYLLGSSVLEIPYKLLAAQLNLSEKKATTLSHLHLTYLLLILLLSYEEEETLETYELYAKVLQKTLPTIEPLFPDHQSQLELIKQSLHDPSALKQAIRENFETEPLSQDIKKLIGVTNSLYEGLNNAFFQQPKSSTTMTQSA